MKNDNEKFCLNCGEKIDSRADRCTYCGVIQPDAIRNTGLNDKWLIAFLLCFIFGVFGAHRFYLGKIGTGILMLVTFGGFGIWYLIDLIILIVGGFRDSNGNILKPSI